MAELQIDVLSGVVAKLIDGGSLTPAERSEVLRIAQGFDGKDSAAAARISPETCQRT